MDVDKEGLKCQYCETSFPTRQDLAIHIDSAHLGNNKRCFICEREFPSRSNLSRHLREVHFGLAPPKNIRESYRSNCNSYNGVWDFQI